MNKTAILTEITDQPLNLKRLFEFVVTDNTGAVDAFVGTVRDHFGERRVVALEYECFVPLAEKVLTEICGEALERFDINRVAAQHRYGKLDIREASVIIVVSSGHRNAAFEACRFVIELIKTRLPVWKKEHFEDGAVWKEGTAVSG